jgi:adenylate kinase family enzyme
MGGETGKLAYILVTLGSKRQAVMAKQALRKEWIGDCLVKVKINDDAQRENFNNRTIIVREIPRYLRVEHVLTLFGTKYGAVTNIELPTEATAIKNIILE